MSGFFFGCRHILKGMSGLPLVARLQHLHRDALPTHRPERFLSEVNNAVLTQTNTAPIRFKLDFSSLYEEHAPRYSACFREGDWFRRGLPLSLNPPADGIESCTRGPGESLALEDSCWGRCLSRDVVTPIGRDKMIAVVTSVATEMSRYISVVPEARLQFEISRGGYQHVLVSRGYQSLDACASDCTTFAGTAVNASYCTEGLVGFDAVLSVTKPPTVEGIAGSGGFCASHRNGSPLWLMMAWHDRLDVIEPLSADAALARYRKLVLHEVCT